MRTYDGFKMVDGNVPVCLEDGKCDGLQCNTSLRDGINEPICAKKYREQKIKGAKEEKEYCFFINKCKRYLKRR